jgi:hypothetical protein
VRISYVLLHHTAENTQKMSNLFERKLYEDVLYMHCSRWMDRGGGKGGRGRRDDKGGKGVEGIGEGETGRGVKGVGRDWRGRGWTDGVRGE